MELVLVRVRVLALVPAQVPVRVPEWPQALVLALVPVPAVALVLVLTSLHSTQGPPLCHPLTPASRRGRGHLAAAIARSSRADRLVRADGHQEHEAECSPTSNSISNRCGIV